MIEKKKLLSGALSLCLLLTMLPMDADAAAEPETYPSFSDISEHSYYYDAVLWVLLLALQDKSMPLTGSYFFRSFAKKTRASYKISFA